MSIRIRTFRPTSRCRNCTETQKNPKHRCGAFRQSQHPRAQGKDQRPAKRDPRKSAPSVCNTARHPCSQKRPPSAVATSYNSPWKNYFTRNAHCCDFFNGLPRSSILFPVSLTVEPFFTLYYLYHRSQNHLSVNSTSFHLGQLC